MPLYLNLPNDTKVCVLCNSITSQCSVCAQFVAEAAMWVRKFVYQVHHVHCFIYRYWDKHALLNAILSLPNQMIIRYVFCLIQSLHYAV